MLLEKYQEIIDRYQKVLVKSIALNKRMLQQQKSEIWWVILSYILGFTTCGLGFTLGLIQV